MKNFLAHGPLMDGEPAQGGGGTPAFDMNAFFTRFEQTLDSKLSGLKPPPPVKKEDDPPPPPAKKEDDPPPPPAKHEDNPVVLALQKEMQKLKDRDAAREKASEETNRRAEEKERHSKIRDHLSNFTFQNDAAKETAFRNFKDDIKRGADGETLTGPDGTTPLTEYLDAQMQVHDYLLKGLEINGSGAANTGQKRQKAVDLDDIKTGMKPEDLDRVRQEISRIARLALGGR